MFFGEQLRDCDYRNEDPDQGWLFDSVKETLIDLPAIDYYPRLGSQRSKMVKNGMIIVLGYKNEARLDEESKLMTYRLGASKFVEVPISD